jgi:cytochrome c-type biogenesis protein
VTIEISAVGLATAMLAGAISFASPCVLPLVPGYLSFVSAGADRQAERLIDRLGLGAQAFGGLLLRYSAEANLIGGALVVGFGLLATGLIRVPSLMGDYRFRGPQTISGPTGSYLLGLAFAFGWTPCIGPVLGAILTAAAMSAGSGAVLLAAYGVGLGIPFLIVAALLGNSFGLIRRLRRAGRLLNVVAGGIMIVMGLLMMTGRLQLIAFWLLEQFPVLGTIG